MRIAATLLVVGLFFCVGCQPTPTPTGDLNLTAADNGGSFTIGTGQILTVTLEENATAGYKWKLYYGPGPNFVMYDSDYIPPTSELEGAPGTRVYKMLAIEPGDTVVGFGYMPVDEYDDDNAEEVWEVNITVTGEAIDSPVYRLTEEDDGSTITVSDPADIVITLDENQTTGCAWEIIEDGYPAVEVTSFEYVPYESEELGTGGRRKIWLQTLASGSATFEVGYYCQGAETPDSTFTVTILIE